MEKKNLKYIIGIVGAVIVVLAVVLLLTKCGKKEDGEGEQLGVEGGLQVEETGEGDVIEFEDLESQEGAGTDTDKDGVVNAEDDDDDNDGVKDTEDDDDDDDGVKDTEDDDDDNDGVTDTKDPDHPSYEGPSNEDKEDEKEDEKENNKDDEETQWSEFF